MTDAALGPGTVLDGRFRLEDLLDESVDARFWRATDLVLARNVSVHVLPRSDPRATALLGAARSSALVSDLRLLRVLDAASVDGLVYVVHEWGSGVSLDRMIAENALSPRRAAWVVKEVAEAITAAHRNGVAHGRLIPENVMISESGSVKLIGFVVDAALRSPDGAHLVVDGTPVTAAESDVLNLAALLYAALVGRWPGTEGSTIPVAPAEHGRPLRPRRVRAGVPRPLDAICEQVLNADAHPAATPIRTAQEIAAALGDFIGDPAGSTAVSPAYGASLPAGATDTDTHPAGEGFANGRAAGEPGADDDLADDDVAAGDLDVDTSELAATGLMAAPDPEATQAAGPLFLDDSGWSSAEPTGATARRSGPADAPTVASPSAPRREEPPVAASAPERPLFADGPPRPATRGSRSGDDGGRGAGQRSTGAGNGPLPTTWGPDADEPTGPRPGVEDHDREDRVPGRRWLGLAVAIGVVVALVVGGIVALNLGRGGKDPTPASRPSASASRSATVSRPLAIADVRDFDPEADPPEENPDLAPLAHDGDPATAWRTVTYTRPNLGGLKSGVGLLVDLGRQRQVREVRLRLIGRPTAVRVMVSPGSAGAPRAIAGMRTLASDRAAGTSVTLRGSSPASTRWLVVWLTSLPPVPGGFQGQVAEVTVRS